MTRVLTFLALLLLTASPSLSHSLGVDRGFLTEADGGAYVLTVKVPPIFQPAILPPELPQRCGYDGPPSGDRGGFQIRFAFTCDAPLTAQNSLRLPWNREGVLLTVAWQASEPVTSLVARDGDAIRVDLVDFRAGSGSTLAAAKRYTLLGVEHILEGFDHLLFVVGLMLLVRGTAMLVKTITAFTLAHSMTLALATLGFVNIPSGPVEAAIALSIVFLAVEVVNMQRGRTSLAQQMPWLVAFGFGLLHGLGFAGALSEIGLPPQEVAIALLFFNIGVEIGQLLFVGAVGPVMLLLRRNSFGVSAMVNVLLVYLLGAVSTYWFIERTISLFA